ncbi:uncharacterized protein FIBRA_04586 [Fibroporia radiculosa]|uniref:Uncharacterized protein n=1 Tax=Fibroporia radiculosa TaxID=599839 RepID=J4IA88_9APHY|nr:uncharacterized protein FIBRA_04586 [Fibroporia radiculosa]CCM02486.1 predicted protein [Fibroporia radiculosa]
MHSGTNDAGTVQRGRSVKWGGVSVIEPSQWSREKALPDAHPGDGVKTGLGAAEVAAASIRQAGSAMAGAGAGAGAGKGVNGRRRGGGSGMESHRQPSAGVALSKATCDSLRSPRPPMAATSIHALPIELLTRIFLFGQDPHPPPSSTAFPDDPPLELTVSHVCAHWRAAALATPALWSHIAIRVVPHIARAREYVVRSRTHPLHLLVDSASEADAVAGYSVFRDEFLDAFASLTPHIARWRALVLRVRDLQCKAHARTVLSSCGPAPTLADLALWHIQDWGSPERLFNAIGPPPVVVFAGGLPALARLALFGVNIQWTASASPFLRRLTHLELGVHSDDVRIPIDRWRAVLAASPALVRLALHYSGPRAQAGLWRLSAAPYSRSRSPSVSPGIGTGSTSTSTSTSADSADDDDLDPDVPAGPVPLPSLAEVRLADLDAPYACAILRTFTAPRLRALQLELGDPEAPQDFAPLAALLAHPPSPAALRDAELDPLVPYVPPPEVVAAVNRSGARDEEEERQRAGSGIAEPQEPPPMFPALETLAIGALADCALASWARLLRRSASLRVLELDAATMAGGAFEVLLDSADGQEGRRRSKSKGKGKERAREDRPDILLPNLHTLRVAGVSGAAIRALVEHRRRAGRPIATWYVHESCRDAETERVKAEMDAGVGGGEAMEWFRDEDDAAEEEEEEGSWVDEGEAEEGMHEDGEGEHEETPEGEWSSEGDEYAHAGPDAGAEYR